MQNGTSSMICKGDSVRLFMARGSVSMSSDDHDLAEKAYLRLHPVDKTRGLKPFRMFCLHCQNQLGVMLHIERGLFPSFQHRAVIFKEAASGRETSAQQWKYMYAQRHPSIPRETGKGASKRWYHLDACPCASRGTRLQKRRTTIHSATRGCNQACICRPSLTSALGREG